jgi:hypothetical protein
MAYNTIWCLHYWMKPLARGKAVQGPSKALPGFAFAFSGGLRRASGTLLPIPIHLVGGVKRVASGCTHRGVPGFAPVGLCTAPRSRTFAVGIADAGGVRADPFAFSGASLRESGSLAVLEPRAWSMHLLPRACAGMEGRGGGRAMSGRTAEWAWVGVGLLVVGEAMAQGAAAEGSSRALRSSGESFWGGATYDGGPSGVAISGLRGHGPDNYDVFGVDLLLVLSLY